MLRIKLSIKNTNIKDALIEKLYSTFTTIEITPNNYFDILFFEIDKNGNLDSLLERNPMAIVIVIGPEDTTTIQQYYSLQTLGYIRDNEYDNDIDTLFPKLQQLAIDRFKVYYLKSKAGSYSIRVNTILYIESYRNYITIHTNSASYTEYKTLSKVLKELNNDMHSFIQIHKSYLIKSSRRR